ncbi:MAG: RNase A-like domain-containing protein [Rummeliibacillus sp.]
MANGTKFIPYSKEYVQNQVQKAQGSIKDMGKAIGKTEVPTGFKVREVADTTGSTHKIIEVDKTTIKDLAQKITANGEGSKSTGGVSPNTVRNVDQNILDKMESAGGHTLERHVSKTNEDLIKRAIKEDVDATSFKDKGTAIKAVQENLRKNADDIVQWLNETDAGRKIFDVSHKNPVGKGALEDNKQVINNLTDSRVVLVRDSTQELGFKILTSFPIIK